MSEDYLEWVRQQDCAFCMKPGPNDAHHIKGVGYFSGIGMKASDLLSMPLCRECHGRMHNEPGLWQDQWEFIVRTIAKAEKEGKIVASHPKTVGKD